MKKRLLSISVIFLVATIAACGNHEQEVKNKAVEQRLLTEKVLAKVKAEAKAKVKEEAEVKAEAEAKVEAEARIQPSSCVAAMDEQKERYKKLTAQKKYWEAATTVRSCAAILNDPTLKTMLADAEVRNYIALINDKRSEAQSRLIALDAFSSDYPDQAMQFKKLRAQLSDKQQADTRSSDMAAAKSSAASSSACSDSEYGIYQQYDTFLERNPSIADYQLRSIFARKVGMQPAALKNLYVRCTVRWVEHSPSESSAYLKNELEGFAKDCAKRGSSDPYCKSVFGR